MSAQSSALAPGRNETLPRRAGSPTRLAVASIVVAGALIVGAAAFAISRGPAAELAPQGATGHAAPVTSSIERELEAGSVAAAAAGTSAMYGPSTLTVTSGVTGFDVRVPAASSPLEQAIASRSEGSDTTVLVTGAGGFAHRMPLR